MYLIKNRRPLLEGIPSSRAGEDIEKMGRVISKKLGRKVVILNIPEYVDFKGKHLAVYQGSTGDTRFLVTFRASGSSLDPDGFYVLDANGTTARYEIDLNGMNLLNVVDLMVSALEGTLDVESDESLEQLSQSEEEAYQRNPFRKKKSRFIERITFVDVLISWFTENPQYATQAASDNSTSFYSSHLDEFNQYLPKHGIHRSNGVKIDSLIYYGPLALQKMGVKGSSVIPMSISTGVASTPAHAPLSSNSPTLTPEEKEAAAAYREAMKLTLESKFEEIIELVRRMANNYGPFALYLYGRPGIGKSYNVYSTLEEEGVKPVIVNGTVTSIEDILRTLYKSRDGKIIVFDDCDSVFSSSNRENILKSILDSKRVRTVHLSGPIGKEQNPGYVPATWDFSSRIIFLSNKNTVNTALASRAELFELDGSREEVMDLVHSKLQYISSEYVKSGLEVTQEDRQAVFDFCAQFEDEKKFPSIDFDFRIYSKCLAEYVLGRFEGASEFTIRRRMVSKMLVNGFELKK